MWAPRAVGAARSGDSDIIVLSVAACLARCCPCTAGGAADVQQRLDGRRRILGVLAAMLLVRGADTSSPNATDRLLVHLPRQRENRPLVPARRRFRWWR
jgi:hypothetical protein